AFRTAPCRGRLPGPRVLRTLPQQPHGPDRRRGLQGAVRKARRPVPSLTGGGAPLSWRLSRGGTRTAASPGKQPMRVCPTVEGSATPLILHRIGVDECLRRQHCNYHKCHRCVYRGQTAHWTPPDHAPSVQATLTTGAHAAPTHNGL